MPGGGGVYICRVGDFSKGANHPSIVIPDEPFGKKFQDPTQQSGF